MFTWVMLFMCVVCSKHVASMSRNMCPCVDMLFTYICGHVHTCPQTCVLICVGRVSLLGPELLACLSGPTHAETASGTNIRPRWVALRCPGAGLGARGRRSTGAALLTWTAGTPPSSPLLPLPPVPCPHCPCWPRAAQLTTLWPGASGCCTRWLACHWGESEARGVTQ